MASRSIDPPAVVETRVVHEAHRRATALLADVSRSATAEPAAVDDLRAFVVAALRHHHESEDHDLWPLLTRAAPDLEAPLAALSAEPDGARDPRRGAPAHDGGVTVGQDPQE